MLVRRLCIEYFIPNINYVNESFIPNTNLVNYQLSNKLNCNRIT